jgi:hypothetical protein
MAVEFFVLKYGEDCHRHENVAKIRFGEPEGHQQRKNFREKFTSLKYKNHFFQFSEDNLQLKI